MYVGTSGWKYRNWRGDFYPTGLRQRDELAYLSRRMNSVEINGSFYSLQTPQRYATWRDQTPDGFAFAVKGSRYLTHMKRLRDPGPGLAKFMASGPRELGGKLGPFLWQLPATLHYDDAVLRRFLEALRDYGPLRHAVEPRHGSWAAAAPLLREFNVALVRADTAGRFPEFTERTADFTYTRLHGPQQLYFGSYRPDLIDVWARRLGEPGYVYFDNDADGAAPWDAIALASRQDSVQTPH